MAEINDAIVETSTDEYKVYNQRWFILLSFSLYSFSNAFGFVQNSPILQWSQAYYNVGESSIIMFSNVYYITYVFLAPVVIKPLQLRLDITIWVGSLVSVIGAWVKYLANQNYYMALFGYILLSLGQLPIIASPVYISNKWFSAHERTISTSIGSFINQIGMNFSFLLAVTLFQNVSDQIENIKLQKKMNLVSAIISTTAFIMCLLFVRNTPKTPPSLISNSIKSSITQTFKNIFSKTSNVVELISLSICNLNCLKQVLGISWTYISTISVILEPFYFSQVYKIINHLNKFQIGIIGLLFNLGGTIGGCIASIVIDQQVGQQKIPKYDYYIKLFMTFGIVTLAIQAAIIKYSNIYSIMVTSSLIGIGLNSYFPIAAQSYVEKLYPNFELALITAFLMASNIFGFIGNNLMVDPIFSSSGLWVLAALILPFYLYIMFFYKTELKRMDAENQIN